MLRFAPSPTQNLDVEQLRLALMTYIYSIQKNEDFIIRIEDIDQSKDIEGKDKEIIGLLELFGIVPKNVLYQSANLKYHRAMALQLIHEKIAFNCFCSPETLQEKAAHAKEMNLTYRYDDACLSLLPEETIDNTSAFRVRLRKPNVDVEFTDLIFGEQKYTPDEIESFIILHTDKSPTYNFACAVDDMLSNISLVIRHEKYRDETPKQIAARAALNYTQEIRYAHVPALEYDEKSAPYTNVKQLIEKGFLPSAIINYLLSLGYTPPEEIFSLEDAVSWFSLEKLSKEPVTFNISDLEEMNVKHLGALDDVELSRYVGFADADIGKLAKLFLDEVNTTKGLKQRISAFFAPKKIPDELKIPAEVISSLIKKAPYIETFDGFNSYLLKESQLPQDELSKSLYVLLGATDTSVELDKIYSHIKNYLSEIVK